ncbi:type I polyketide synthase, partial [Streptomyces sp. NPDC047315]|uniref:acyl carrier protein n=1 Tax=Streptomyces sp. NPDC047315 TaxID=3155142 RepID=UPI0034030B34
MERSNTRRNRKKTVVTLADRLADLADEDRFEYVLDLVCAATAELLGQDAETVDPQRAYRDYGYNSLAAVELTNQLSRQTGLQLPLTMLFDQPNPTAVAHYVLSQAIPEKPVDQPAGPAASAPSFDEPIAIVGMACRFPGGVASPGDLWDLVAGGGDAVGAFPVDRGWDVEGLYHPDPDHPGTAYTRSGGFLEDVAGFDAEFFGISPREALAMDPQQRLMLEGVWESLESAGIDPAELRGTPTGVFVGACGSDYASLARTPAAGLEGHWGVGSAGSVVSGRVAYVFGLEGPAVTVDTACSSSLVGLHLAVRSLRLGECS